MKWKLRFWFSLAMALLLLGVFFYRVSLVNVGRHLAQTQPFWILLALCCGVSSVLLRVLRWQWILSSLHQTSFSNAAAATFMGYAFSTLLPARIGELLRPLYLATQEDMGKTITVSSVVLERLMDLPTIVFLTLLALGNRHHVTILVFSLLCGLFVVLYGLKKFHKSLEAYLLPKVPVRFQKFFQEILSSLHLLPSGWKGLVIWSASLGIWLLVGLQNYGFLLALHIHLPFPSAFVITAATSVGFLLPTPGGVGGVHKSIQVALHHFYGVGYDLATAVALLFHTLTMGTLTLIGVGYMVRRKVWWRDFWKGDTITS